MQLHFSFFCVAALIFRLQRRKRGRITDGEMIGREYRIPEVSSSGTATMVIKDGQRMRGIEQENM